MGRGVLTHRVVNSWKRVWPSGGVTVHPPSLALPTFPPLHGFPLELLPPPAEPSSCGLYCPSSSAQMPFFFFFFTMKPMRLPSSWPQNQTLPSLRSALRIAHHPITKGAEDRERVRALALDRPRSAPSSANY